MSGDEIYQRTRSWVGALMQVITYREFLPVLLGEHGLPTYIDWDPWADGSIANEFSTAAYRFGHSMVSVLLLRLDRYGNEIHQGHLELRDAFFAPHHLEAAGIEPILRGLVAQQAREVDLMIVDELRNFLFGPPGSGGFDLAALNIQRGRDHGLECYNQTRMMYGLEPYTRFEEITPDGGIAAKLETLYGDIDEVDLWVGGLAEPHVRGALLGPTFCEIIRDQFQRLRDADRFFYKRAYRGNELLELESTTLANVIRRNTPIGHEIPDNVFYVR